MYNLSKFLGLPVSYIPESKIWIVSGLYWTAFGYSSVDEAIGNAEKLLCPSAFPTLLCVDTAYPLGE